MYTIYIICIIYMIQAYRVLHAIEKCLEADADFLSVNAACICVYRYHMCKLYVFSDFLTRPSIY